MNHTLCTVLFTSALATSALAVGCSSQSDSSNEAASPAGDDAGAVTGQADAGAVIAHGDAGAVTGQTDGGAARQPVLNEGEYSAQAFAYQDPHDTGFNPLGSARTGLLRFEAMAYVADDSDAGAWVVGDSKEDGGTSTIAPNPVGAGNTPVWAGSGNFTDDGHADLVVVSYQGDNLYVTVSMNAGSAPLEQVQSLPPLTVANLVPGAVKAAIGDFDGDGRDEIALAATSSNGAGWVRVYDDATAGFALLNEVQTIASGRADVDLAAGNFDADPAAELAILHVGKASNDVSISVIDDATAGFAVRKTIPAASLLPSNGAGSGQFQIGGLLRAGHLDPGTQDDLFVMLESQDQSDNGGGLYFTRAIVRDVSGTAGLTTLEGLADAVDAPYGAGTLAHPFDAALADLDGDGVDELYVTYRQAGGGDNSDGTEAWELAQWVPGNEFATWPSTSRGLGTVDGGEADAAQVGTWQDAGADGSEPAGPGIIHIATLDTGYGGSSMVRMAVADDNGLVGEGVTVALTKGSSAPITSVQVTGSMITEANDTHGSWMLTISAPTHSSESFASAKAPLVAGGDFNNDSLKVRYTGNHWTTLANPTPLVVIAAPPVKDGISQNAAVSGTSYGEQDSTETDATNEVGATYTTTLSFQKAIDLPEIGEIGSAGVSANLSNSFTDTSTVSSIVDTGTVFNEAYPDNCIIFDGVLHVSYSYEIVGASDPSMVGQLMTIDVPVAVKTYKWTLGYYNAKLPPGAVAIGSETLGQTVGDPSSYPSAGQADMLLKAVGGWESAPMTVGQGGGSNTVTINVGTASTTGESNAVSGNFVGSGDPSSFETIENDIDWNVSFAGFGYSQSYSYDQDAAYSITVGKTTQYQGTVGDISDAADYNNYAYDFGLFVYNFKHPQGPTFAVVNYWTSNLAPGYN
jgi:hypothetical protein